MPDFDPHQLSVLSAQIEGLEAAVEGLAGDPSVGVSVRRIARSLHSAAQSVGVHEIAAGADAIQKASEAQLGRSVRNFLDRIEELRADALSFAAVGLEELNFRRYPRMRDLVHLLFVAIAENVGYRQISIYWRLRGMISKARGASSWGAMERKGFAGTTSDDEVSR